MCVSVFIENVVYISTRRSKNTQQNMENMPQNEMKMQTDREKETEWEWEMKHKQAWYLSIQYNG